MEHDDISLDDLFREAKTHLRLEKQTREAQRKNRERGDEAKPKAPSALYTDPENWIPARLLGLVHKETQTLLGTFREHRHRTVADCRRLVREDTRAQLDAVEYVSGEWGMAGPVEREAYLRTDLPVRVPTTIELESPAISALVLVDVFRHPSGEGIARVELAEASYLAGMTQFLSLPAGTNVWQLMTVASKANLWKEIQCPN